MIVLSHFGAFLVHFFGPQKQEKTPLSVFRRGFCQKYSGESEIPPAEGRRYLGALPGGPGNPATAQRPDGRSGRFGIRRPRASSRPPHTKTARRLRAGLLLVAERARFELAIPFWGTHAFQACLFSHSSISPIRIRGLSVKTGLQR